MRVLLTHGHTLYAKVTIPLAVRLVAEGHEVVVEHRGRRRFSDRYVLRNPTEVSVVDSGSLAYVARLIGLEREWDSVAPSVRVTRRPRGHFDAIVGTTKDLGPLRERAAADERATVWALGYQHMPFVVRVGGREGGLERSLFLRENPFTEAHGFLDILGDDDAWPNSFTFLDRVVERRPSADPKRDRVLIFHPGGWRGVVTAAGDDGATSRRKQRAFFERACRPLLAAGLRPVIKVHPLRALHHDLADVETVAREIDPGIEVLAPDDWFWDDAFHSAFVVNYGSSSVYELWSAGIRSAIVCNFEGTARSEKFAVFESVFVDTHEAYVDFVEDERWRSLELDPLAAEVAAAYEELCDGHATEDAAELIEGRL
jgi:hypothetical protein